MASGSLSLAMVSLAKAAITAERRPRSGVADAKVTWAGPDACCTARIGVA